MKRVEQLLTVVMEAVIVCAFVVILLLVVIQVLNSAIPGANEVVIILFVYTTALGGALAAGRREHIALTFATDLLPENLRKVMARVSLLLVAWINAVMVWFSMHWIGITGDYLMPSTGLTRSVTQVSIPLGCGWAAVYCMVKAIAPLNLKPEAIS